MNGRSRLRGVLAATARTTPVLTSASVLVATGYAWSLMRSASSELVTSDVLDRPATDAATVPSVR